MTVEIQQATPSAGGKSLSFSARAFPWIIVAAIGAIAFFWEGLISLGVSWARPEYSYGPMVPLITAYLTLREIHHRPVKPVEGGRLLGIFAFVLAIFLGLIGNLAQIPDVITYGFIVYIGALILLLAGTREGWRFWPGWLHLIFMLPLPQFIYLHVSTDLQHISSVLGVFFVELANVPVFLDGNIIDLGTYKLQVAEACSGLRYLFPLFSFGWMMAVLYNGPNWHRVIIFASTVPVTIVMNSIRIGITGLLVNAYGIEQAEGFLHFFEGWIIFIACTAILYVEALILWRFFSFGGQREAHVLYVDFEGILQPLKKFGSLRATKSFIAAALIIVAAGAAWQLRPTAPPADISRVPLGVFPLQLDEWQGQNVPVDAATKDVLGADDYVNANYQSGSQMVNVLMTFYRSQTEGVGIHSPEVCIPSAGWEVSNWHQQDIAVEMGNQTRMLEVNRAIIQKGLQRQLVYFWFEQRGRQTINDYEVKALSVWDTIMHGRSDGGLVRLTTPIGQAEATELADQRLQDFLPNILRLAPDYFPGL